MFKVTFYKKRNGHIPVTEFLDDLENKKLKAKVFQDISILEEFGYELREPLSKPLGDGIFELRTKFSSDITRVLYFFYHGKKIILTNGFLKKSGKTPTQVIELAKKYRADYYAQIDEE